MAKKSDITRSDAKALTKKAVDAGHAHQSEAQKTERLGRAIANAVIARGAFSETDMIQAGFSKVEGQALYPGALAYAQSLDPAIDTAALI